MTVVRIILAFACCVGCFGVAFVSRTSRQAWVILGGAMFWLVGGNFVIWHVGDYANHWIRWSPFYWLVLLACVKAAYDSIRCRRKARSR